jgi:hypothetical protein
MVRGTLVSVVIVHLQEKDNTDLRARQGGDMRNT